jgi:hypothetical protein
VTTLPEILAYSSGAEGHSFEPRHFFEKKDEERSIEVSGT